MKGSYIDLAICTHTEEDPDRPRKTIGTTGTPRSFTDTNKSIPNSPASLSTTTTTTTLLLSAVSLANNNYYDFSGDYS